MLTVFVDSVRLTMWVMLTVCSDFPEKKPKQTTTTKTTEIGTTYSLREANMNHSVQGWNTDTNDGDTSIWSERTGSNQATSACHAQPVLVTAEGAGFEWV